MTLARAFLDGPHQPRGAPGVADTRGLPGVYKRYPAAGRVPFGDSELGRMLREINGLTRMRWMPAADGGELVAGRRAPSSGARYPIEVYVATGDGLHHYDPAHHWLDQLRAGDGRSLLADCLVDPPEGRPELVLLLSTVFWRNCVKYGPFGYRLQGLDAGVLIGQTLAVASAHGYRARVHLRFDDDRLDQLLGLQPYVESVYAAVTLTRNAGAAGESADWSGPAPAELAAVPAIDTIPALADVARLHAAARLASTRPGVPLDTTPPEPLPGAERRRTVHRFNRRPVPSADLDRLLDIVNRPVPADPVAADPSTIYLQASGTWRYDRGLVPTAGGPLAPAAQSAMLAEEFRTAAVTVVPVGDYERGLRSHGDRWYRMRNIEAGILAQRVCLAAAAMGMDSHVHCDFDVTAMARALGVDEGLPLVVVTAGYCQPERTDPQGEL
ncbi:SagB family peptide dehydrogenase [Kutzneria buriramensis]|uniref:SagB-type dehydrogenase family enzyme n=1 Tax=Kutzneria buriramensis TaxID=1045776 RepID=A0A3E0GZY2_9PSEU|nr:SagB family peptide dehydrogenase [Kutzneria buriramensis]REH35711.1 SagB-type dehydrogenase family enzyme [Kutzneria buriramensis]